jgi:hypothetical protein
MTGPDREPVAIFGMVAALLTASVVPFAIPVLWAPGATSGPAAEPPAKTPSGPAATPEAGDRGTATPGTAAPGTASTAGGHHRPVVNTATPPPANLRVECTGDGSTAPTGSDRGDGAAVAVLDPTGFDVEDPLLDGRVAATASFARDEPLEIGNGGSDDHGTASARVVASQAPGASLYLANFRTAYDFERAVEWALEQDVDVIVAPTVFHAKPDDGTAPVSEAVAEAAAAGVTVVVPTGNAARNHWEGGYDGNGTVAFEPGDTRLYLEEGDDRVEAWLWWNRSDDVDVNAFSVVLYRDTDNGSRQVATSRDYPVGPVGTNQALSEQVPTNGLLSSDVDEGTYFLRIEGPPDEVHRVELVVPTHRLARPTAAGSIAAPATADAPGVVAVGAADPATGEPLPTSGRGPTNDGRVGVDVLAPSSPVGAGRFTGTSMAAAYTGGLAAAMHATNRSLSPGRTERVLAATADDENRTMAAGWGTVDPDAAIACAR